MRFFRILTHRAAAVGALLAAVACGKDTTAPSKATSLTVSVTGTITGKVNAAVTPTPTFTVLDEKGNAMANVPVTVSVTGGGTVAGVVSGAAGAGGRGWAATTDAANIEKMPNTGSDNVRRFDRDKRNPPAPSSRYRPSKRSRSLNHICAKVRRFRGSLCHIARKPPF